MEIIPISIELLFILTTLITLFFFYCVLKQSKEFSYLTKKITIGLILWLILQYLISSSGFYIEHTNITPPPFLFAFIPTLLFIIFIFYSKKGILFIDSLPLLMSTYLHMVRIPVEIVLYYLAFHKTIPELMTFVGRNFDIIAGITAPFVAYFGYRKQLLNKGLLLIWNVVCLGLLLFIIANAILSAPFTFQQFAFEQPNIAVFYFPYVWLPSFIVPIVLFCHLVSIRQLTKK